MSEGVTASVPGRVRAELERFVGHLGTLRRPVLEWMTPGVGAERVEAVVGEPVPASVAVWFGWCDGIAVHPGQSQDDVNVIPGYSPLSVEEACRVKAEYEGDTVLGDHWVPLLGGAGGDLYAAVWSPGGEAEVAGVLVGEPTEREFASVGQMVEVFNHCFAEGAYFVDDRGRWAMDPARYDEMYERLVGE
ncbi:hypothetical protein [Streptomyces sp. cmx-4-25]|uniref:hypothetical protein n=1 Tax=Streptomyces sp. cmx-4-25 TaxID=2790933 RepID=UPI00397F4B7F